MDSITTEVIHHTFHQPLVTNYSLDAILAYHRSIKGLNSKAVWNSNHHTTSPPISYTDSSLKYSNSLDKNVSSIQQQNTISFYSQDSSDELEGNENQSDHKNHKSPSTSPSSSSSSNDSTKSLEDEDETNSNHYRTHTNLEIAVLLSLFRHRHLLSKSCITDLCRLLRLLGVKDVPADYRGIYNLINPSGNSIFTLTLAIVCPTCNEVSTNMDKCSVKSCISHVGYVRAPTVNYTFKVVKQIRSILQRVPLKYSVATGAQVADVVDSIAHARIHAVNKKPFITLMLNSDGVVIRKISRSLWITSFVINEIPRNIRFELPNLVIGMISYGSQKPKRAEFAPLLARLVDELIELEHGIDVYLPSSVGIGFSSNTITRVAVYLLGIVADKPAQSMLQNMTDSGGYYGCGKCLVVGKKMKTYSIIYSILEKNCKF
ncbi:unnamed protein product [Rotaria sp. Silwood2]|nr:unnamed protein product [Rotaria sp. Silwood2]CAF3225053.1 unnamed protein product [Rotaria sp. Silwood2]CAF4239323.1 unnamed protein product [Rotaria sp. Silwood2]CAF4259184.1 unnamed protein product [Rotaria sp. Silwood2]